MKRLIVFDLEGTIFKARYNIEGVDFATTMWSVLAYKIDAVEKEKATHENWEEGIYKNYREWVEDTFRIHKEHKLTQKVFNEALETAEYNEGVIEFFEQLDRREWIPVIISGAFQELVDRAREELNISYGYGACRYSFNPLTGLLEKYNYDPCDYHGKFGQFSKIAKEEGIKEGPFIFIGDGKNDEYIARKASIALGINPHDKLKAISGFKEINSFMDIIEYLDNYEMHAKDTKKKKQEEKKKQPISKETKWRNDRKILIIGNSDIPEEAVLAKAKKYNINNEIEYKNDYNNNFNFNNLKNNKAYSYFFLGQMPHSVKGKGGASSIHAKIKNNPELYAKLYPNVIKKISANDLDSFFKWINVDKNKV